MKNITFPSKIAFIVLGLYLGSMAMPNQGQAQNTNPLVTAAETAITNFFAAISNTQDPITVQNVPNTSVYHNMQTAMAAVAANDPNDLGTVQAFYNKTSVKTAETAVGGFFTTISNQNSPVTVSNIPNLAAYVVLQTTMYEVDPNDQSAVQTYFNTHSVSTAESAIGSFFTAISNQNSPVTVSNIPNLAAYVVLQSTMYEVDPNDQSAVQTYFNAHSVSAAESAIGSFFTAISNQKSPVTVSNIPNLAAYVVLQTTMNEVDPNDKSAVQTYFNAHSISTAESAIGSFFTAISNQNSPVTVSNIPNLAAYVVLQSTMYEVDPNDQSAVQIYFNAHSVSAAESAIGSFFTAISNQNSPVTVSNIPNLAAYVVLQTTMNEVDPNDKSNVQTYFNTHSVSAAESAIGSFFTAISNQNSPVTVSNIPNLAAYVVLQTTMNEVDPNDKSNVQTYFNTHSVSTVESAIGSFFSAISNQSSPVTVSNIPNLAAYVVLQTTMNEVDPNDKSAVQTYFNAHSVSTAESAIGSFFTAISNQKSPVTVSNIPNLTAYVVLQTTMNEVDPNDKSAVQTYFNAHSISTAESAIGSFFTAISNQNSPVTVSNIPNLAAYVVLQTTLNEVDPNDQSAVQTYFNAHSVSTAESAIGSFFSAISNQSSPVTVSNIPNLAAYVVLQTTMNEVDPNDKSAVQTYFNAHSVSTAESAIGSFFTAISNQKSPVTVSNIPNLAAYVVLQTTMNEVDPNDRSAVQAYFNSHSVSAAESAIGSFFSAISNQSSPVTVSNIPNLAAYVVLQTTMNEVDPNDQSAVQAYFNSHSVSAAESAIGSFFTAISNQSSPVTVSNIPNLAAYVVLQTTMNEVDPNDQSAVQAYFNTHSVSTAETAIYNYFAALISGQNTSNLLIVMQTTMQEVDPADQQTVANYYNQQQALYFYQLALKAISQYQANPNSANLAAAVQAVLALQQYNSISVSSSNTLGVYDAALNQLIQIVQNSLTRNNSVAAVTPPVNADNSFSSTVAVDSGSVFISAPSNSNSGFGAVYEFKKNSQNHWSVVNEIVPTAPNPGDHFGRLFGVKGNFMAVSSEPENGQAAVYIFARQTSGAWVQQNILELTTFSQLSAIHQISLAASVNEFGGYVVVGLPEYGEYMVLDQQFTYSTSTNQLLSSQWLLALQGSLNPGSGAATISVAADGNFAAIGSPSMSTVRILFASYNVVSRSVNNVGTAVYSTNWAIDPNEAQDVHSANLGFGQAVAIDQSPEPTAEIGAATLPTITVEVVNQITLAIGSPLEGAGRGAVYTMVKGNPGASTFVWSSPSLVNLLIPSLNAPVTPLIIGYSVALQNNTLMINTKLRPQATTNYAFGPVTADQTPSEVMVYQLNSNNQWAWAYTLNTPYGASIAAGSGGNTAIGALVPSGKSGTSQVTVITPNPITCTPSTCTATYQCGSSSGIDNCGNPCTVPVGNCPSGFSCTSLDQCVCRVTTCTATYQCGSTAGINNCGQPCVATPGSCPINKSCITNSCVSNTSTTTAV